MALSDEDRTEIQGLLKTSLSGFPKVLDEKLQSWMKEEVIPMINGAKKGTLVDVETKLTNLSEAIEEIKTSQAQKTGMSGEDIDKAIATSLEKILGDSGDSSGGANKDGKGGKDDSGAAPFDFEKLKQEISKEFEETKLNPLKSRLDAAEKAQETAEREKQELEKKQQATARDQAFIATLGKSNLIDTDAARPAFRTLVDEGLIQLSEDGSSYVVKERDKYDQGDVFVPAAERLEKLAAADQLKYYRPARGGSGTGSSPATNPTKSAPEYKVISPDDVEGMDAGTVLERMKENPDDFLSDLDKLATS